MDKELLDNICKLQSEMHGFPFRAVTDSEMSEVAAEDGLAKRITAAFFGELKKREQSGVSYVLSDNFYAVGYVAVANTPYYLCIGPLPVAEQTKENASNIYLEVKSRNAQCELSELQNYFLSARPMSFETFIHLLCLLGAELNKTIIEPDLLIQHGLKNKPVSSQLEILDKEKQIVYFEAQRKNTVEYENKIIYCVQNGLTETLEKLLASFSQNMGKLGPNLLRHYKNAVIILNSLSLRAAISGGMNADTCFSLGEIYIRQIEACSNVDALGRIANDIITDYCERVKRKNLKLTESEDVNAAMRYISENYYKKLTVADIAGHVYLSPEYLSVKFHKVTGVSIPNYINSQKVTKAKELLALTDMPISEISEFLSFSSQSYFQNVFKAIAFVTPLAYRAQYTAKNQALSKVAPSVRQDDVSKT